MRKHVNKESKSLIDYLEANQNKLIIIGDKLLNEVKSAKNPEKQLLSLFVLNNLINAIEKFIDDGIFVLQMLETHNHQTTETQNQLIRDHIIQFEFTLAEIITYCLEKAKSSILFHPIFHKILFKRIIYCHFLWKCSKTTQVKNIS